MLRWGLSLGAVLAVHAIVIAAVGWWHASGRRESSAVPARAVMVELAPRPTAPRAVQTDLPPDELQREQRKARPKALPAPMPEPESQQKPLEKTEIALPQHARRQNDESADNDAAQASAPPSVQAPSDSRYAASQSVAGATSPAMATWQAAILGRLDRFKRYSRDAQRRRLSGTVQVQFQVDRQGRVLAVDVVRSSGHEALDAEAVATVQRASPLPPPPPEFPGDPLTVTTPVDFSLPGR